MAKWCTTSGAQRGVRGLTNLLQKRHGGVLDEKGIRYCYDFGNIFKAIMGYLQLSLMHLHGEDQLRADLEHALEATTRGTELIKQILLRGAGKTHGQDRRVVVAPIVTDVCRYLRANLPDCVEIRCQDKSEDSQIFGDGSQIRQMIANLCANAAKAMDGKAGVLTLSLVNVQRHPGPIAPSSRSEPERFLRLTVSGTGEEMDLTTLKHVFEPYCEELDDDIGSGLGLAVVRGIVRRHGGMIRVLSEPGKGATFQVDLPVAVGDGRKARPSESRPLPGPARILLVDDEEAITVLTAKMLRRLGYEVFTETNSAEALTTFKKAPQDFDLIFTDYFMPQLTGADLAREILAIRPDIPIVLCTGFSAGLTREDVMLMGIRELMSKPVDLESLENVLSKALREKT